MNRYRFINQNATLKDAIESAQKRVSTDLDEIIDLSTRIGKYVFIEDAELKAKMLARKFDDADLVVEVSEINGRIVKMNRMLFHRSGLGDVVARVYGTDKDVMPEKHFTAKEIADLTFGFCKSDGVFVGEDIFDAKKGEKVEKRHIYVNLA